MRGTGPLDVADARDPRARAHARAAGPGAQSREAAAPRRAVDAGSVDAFRALVEGDATRIEGQYLQGLSEADRNAYAQRDAQSRRARRGPEREGRPGGRRRPISTPPYIFGAPIARVLAAAGGNAAVDAALDGRRRRRASTSTRAGRHTPDLPPRPGAPRRREEAEDLRPNDESLDNFDLFLMLAAKLDLPTALRAADAFSSGFAGRVRERRQDLLPGWSIRRRPAASNSTSHELGVGGDDAQCRREPRPRPACCCTRATPAPARRRRATRGSAPRCASPRGGTSSWRRSPASPSRPRWPCARRGCSCTRARLPRRDPQRREARPADTADGAGERRRRADLPGEPAGGHPVAG